MNAHWSLAIDVGTAQVKAATIVGSVNVLPLSTHAAGMPAGIYAESSQSILAGHRGAERAASHPSGYFSSPRRSVGFPVVTVNGYDLDPADALAAIYREVLALAALTVGPGLPAKLALTYPDDWTAEQIRVMYAAAEKTGVARDAIVVVPETVAALHYFASTGAFAAGTHDAVIVVDVGGSSTEVGIYSASELTPLAVRRDEMVGAESFDTAIRTWIDRTLALANPTLAAALRQPSDADSAALAAAITRARIDLNTVQSVEIVVQSGALAQSVVLTAVEYAHLIDGQVQRIMDLFDQAIQAVGSAVGGSSAICVTGGATRSRQLFDALSARGQVKVGHDPDAVIVCGAFAADSAGVAGNYPEIAAPVANAVAFSNPTPRPGASAAPAAEAVAVKSGMNIKVLALAAAVFVVIVTLGVVVGISLTGSDAGETVEIASGDTAELAVAEVGTPEEKVKAVVTEWVDVRGAYISDEAKTLTCPESRSSVSTLSSDQVSGRSWAVEDFASVTANEKTATAVVNVKKSAPNTDAVVDSHTFELVLRSDRWLVCGALPS